MSVSRERLLKEKNKNAREQVKDAVDFLKKNSDKAYTTEELMTEGVLDWDHLRWFYELACMGVITCENVKNDTYFTISIK